MTEQTTTQATYTKRWVLVLVLYLLGLFMGALDTGIITPARTVIQNDLGVDEKFGIWGGMSERERRRLRRQRALARRGELPATGS